MVALCSGPVTPKGMLGMEGMCLLIDVVWEGSTLPSETWVVEGLGIVPGIPRIWVVVMRGGVTPMLGIPIIGGGSVLGIPKGGMAPILGIPNGFVVTVGGTVVVGFVDVAPIALVKRGSYCDPAMGSVGDVSVGCSDSASESDVK